MYIIFCGGYKNTSKMKDEVELEYVLSLSEDKYKEFLTTVPKDEANRMMTCTLLIRLRKSRA